MKIATKKTEMATFSEMPSWIKCVSVSMRVVTSPGPRRSKKAMFWRRMAFRYFSRTRRVVTSPV